MEIKEKIRDTYNEISELKDKAKIIMYIDNIKFEKNDVPTIRFKIGVVESVEPDIVKLETGEKILHRYIRYYSNKTDKAVNYPHYNEELVIKEILEKQKNES